MTDITDPDGSGRPHSSRVSTSRRRLLAAGGAMAASAVSVATAGCLGNGDENDNGNNEDSEDGTENGDENGGDNGDDASAEAAITSLDVAGEGEQASVGADQSTVATEVTVENAGEAAGALDVTVTIGDGEAATTSTATLEAGASETVTLEAVTVPAAVPTETTHTVTATAWSGGSEDSREGELTVAALDAEPAITELTIDGESPAAGSESLRTGTDLPVAVTVTNEGSATASFDVTANAGEESETATAAEVASGESGTVALSGLTADLPAGSHDLTAETAVDSRTVALEVVAEPAIDATVYTQSVAEANLAESGTLVVTDEAGDEVASRDLSSDASVVLTDGVEDGETYTLAVEEPNGGAFPPASETVTVDGLTDVTLVAGYEFQGAESYDFTAYTWWAERTREWGYKGSYAATGNYYSLWVASNRIIPSFSIDDSLFDRDIGMWELKDDVLGGNNPSTEIVVDGQGYGRKEGGTSDGSWTQQSTEKVAQYPGDYEAHQTVLNPLDELTENGPERQSYVGEDEVNGVAVDVYDIDLKPVTEGYGDATVYVDPETGYVMRFETADKFPFSDDPDTYYIIEIMNHDGVPEFDFEAIGFDRDDPNISSS